jgi:hypothetical protein
LLNSQLASKSSVTRAAGERNGRHAQKPATMAAKNNCGNFMDKGTPGIGERLLRRKSASLAVPG